MTLPSLDTGRRTRRGEDRRRELLTAARDIFSTQGYERTSMAEIAARVGIVEGAIYKHFASKRELLFEAARSLYEPLVAATEQELAGIQGTRSRLRFVILRHLQAFANHPDLCRLIIREIRPHDDYYGSGVRELNRKTTSQVLTILEEAIFAGEVHQDVHPSLVRDVIFGGIEHVAWKALSGRGTLDVQRQADEITQLILGGIQTKPTANDPSREEVERLRAQIDRLESLVTTLTERA
jgi:AcrR family transcriptional regulator